MNEWGIPVSKDKIIARRNKLIEYQKVGELRFTPLYEIIDVNILDINYMLHEIDNLQSKINKINKFCDYSFKNPWYVSEKELLGKIIDISKDDDMNEATIHSQIEEVIEKIKNKNYMQEVIDDINKISKNLYELPLYHDYIEMVVLFNETYNTCLVFNGKGE